MRSQYDKAGGYDRAAFHIMACDICKKVCKGHERVMLAFDQKRFKPTWACADCAAKVAKLKEETDG